MMRRLFVRVPDLEYFHDPLQNIQGRFTLGGSVGYDLIKTKRTEWDISAGPAYQFTRFNSVEVGQSDTSDSIALVLASYYDIELTRGIDFIFEYRGLMTGPNEGNNTQHTAVTLQFEIHKRLDLDVSFIWDRVQNPETQSDGTTPSPNDYRLVLGMGVNF